MRLSESERSKGFFFFSLFVFLWDRRLAVARAVARLDFHRPMSSKVVGSAAGRTNLVGPSPFGETPQLEFGKWKDNPLVLHHSVDSCINESGDG